MNWREKLNQHKTQKDEEIQQLCGKAEEALADLELEQKRSVSLEEELKTTTLLAKLDKRKALDVLQEEHKRSLVREQKLVGEEKVRAHDWIAELKSGLRLEKQNFQDKIFELKEKLKKTPADPAGTTAHVPPPPDSSGKRSMEAGRGMLTTATAPATPTPPTDSIADSSWRVHIRNFLYKWDTRDASVSQVLFQTALK